MKKQTLKQLVAAYLAKAGSNGMVRLALESNVSLRTVYKVKNEDYMPNAPTTYKLAKACGASESLATHLSTLEA